MDLDMLAHGALNREYLKTDTGSWLPLDPLDRSIVQVLYRKRSCLKNPKYMMEANA